MKKLGLDPFLSTASSYEIYFYHPQQLVMYGIFKLDVPIDCYVLIVPPFWSLTQKENQHHHMGIIMGLDHDSSMEIRTFVNQAIFNPMKKFERLTKLEALPQLPAAEIPIEVQEKEESDPREVVTQLDRKVRYRRSKL